MRNLSPFEHVPSVPAARVRAGTAAGADGDRRRPPRGRHHRVPPSRHLLVATTPLLLSHERSVSADGRDRYRELTFTSLDRRWLEPGCTRANTRTWERSPAHRATASSGPRPTSCVSSSPSARRSSLLLVEWCSVTRSSPSRRICCADSTPCRTGSSTSSSSGRGSSASSCSAVGSLWTMCRRRWRMLVTVALAALLAAAAGRRRGPLIDLDEGAGAGRRRRRSRPAGRRRLPDRCGARRGRRGAHRGRAVAEPLVAAGGMGAARRDDGDGVPGVAGVVRLARRRPSSAGSPAPPCSWRSERRRGDRRREAVVDGLAGVGLPVRQLEPAGVDARGSTPYFGVADGRRRAVRQGARRRRAQRRPAVPPLPPDPAPRLRRREAVLVAAARRRARGARRARRRDLRVRTPRLRAFATADPNGYVLAYDRIEGRSLDRLEPSEVTDDVLAAIWRLVGRAAASTASPTATSGWRTSSSTTAARCG